MKKDKIILFLILILILSGIFYSGFYAETYHSSGKNKVIMIKFYGQGCPHCAELKIFLDKLKRQDKNIIIQGYEVYFNNTNRELFKKLCEKYNTTIYGVPGLFIGDEVIWGFDDSTKEKIINKIKKCEDEFCENPLKRLTDKDWEVIKNTNPDKPIKVNLKIIIPAVISGAIVDAINPCAFAVLIILITTILISKSRRKALFAGLAFSTSIFISYFFMGLGLYSAIQATGISHIFYILVSILAILIGLFNLKDYFWYGKWFVMEVPLKWRPRMKLILKGITSVPGAFIVGFLISLFLLPCTSGPYLVILGLLSNLTTRDLAIWLLILYNLIFILPMVGITLGIYLGITDSEKAEKWRTSKLKKLHFIAGIILLVLGIIMLFSVILGKL